MQIHVPNKFDHARGAFDTAYFGQWAVPEWICDTPPPWHVALWEFSLKDPGRYKYVVAPRHHSKTTCKLVEILQRIAYAPRDFIDHIGFVSEAAPQAENNLENMKSILTDGVEFPRLFPHAAGKGPTWGAEEIITAGGHLFGSYGTRQKVRGRRHRGIRFRKLIFDDFESPETDSPLERGRIKRWALGAAKYALHEPTGTIDLIGTMTFDDSLLATVRTAKSWVGMFLRAMYQDGDPHRELYGEDGMLWGTPHTNQDGDQVAFDRTWWERARQNAIDEGELSLFNREIQNELTSSEEDFDENKIVFYEDMKYEDGLVLVKPKNGAYRPVRVALGIDSSTREHKDADWCVLMPVGMDAEKTIYQLPYLRERYGDDVTRIADVTFELHGMYGFPRAGVETIAAQKYIQGELRRQMPERNRWFTIVPLHPRVGKESRVFGLKPRVDAGKLQFHPKVNEQLIYELTHYKSSKFKDTADALQMACSVASPWRSSAEPEPPVIRNEYGAERVLAWDWMTERWL